MAVATGRRVIPDTLSGRAGEMQRRLERRLEKAGIAPAARTRILETSAHAMAHRVAALGDDEHFDALHPARTMLILLDDCDVADADLLQAAASVESELPALRVAAANDCAAEVPIPADAGDALLELLVVADEPVRLVALAERLDHARHLHLRPRPDWAAFHASIGTTYSPVAHRTHARLARRYAWWWTMFRDRFLEPGNHA